MPFYHTVKPANDLGDFLATTCLRSLAALSTLRSTLAVREVGRVWPPNVNRHAKLGQIPYC